MYAMIGSGTLSADGIVKKLMPSLNQIPKTSTVKTNKVKGNVLVDNNRGMMTRFAKCCLPIMGDEIVGFVSIGKGVTIHRKDCINVKTLDKDRFIPVSWDDNQSLLYLAKINVKGDSSAIAKITNLMSKMGVLIKLFEVNPSSPNQYTITLTLKSHDELDKVVSRIKQIDNISSVERV